jgi:hypothetical protein
LRQWDEKILVLPTNGNYLDCRKRNLHCIRKPSAYAKKMKAPLTPFHPQYIDLHKGLTPDKVSRLTRFDAVHRKRRIPYGILPSTDVDTTDVVTT